MSNLKRKQIVVIFREMKLFIVETFHFYSGNWFYLRGYIKDLLLLVLVTWPINLDQISKLSTSFYNISMMFLENECSFQDELTAMLNSLKF